MLDLLCRAAGSSRHEAMQFDARFQIRAQVHDDVAWYQLVPAAAVGVLTGKATPIAEISHPQGDHAMLALGQLVVVIGHIGFFSAHGADRMAARQPGTETRPSASRCMSEP